MARTRTKSKPCPEAALQATLARALAPEEIRPGDHLAVLYEIVEIPSWYWCDDSALVNREDVVRIRYVPREDAVPLKVRAVCLPFVLAKHPRDGERTLDVRRCRLAKIDPNYAKAARKAYRKTKSKRQGGRDSYGSQA
jgi:hypothetical protein